MRRRPWGRHYSQRHGRRTASTRGHGAGERRARARAELVGMRGPASGRPARGRVRATSATARPRVTNPFLRGPARLAEAIALLPQVRRRMPGARLPFERPRVLTAMIAGATATQIIRGSRALSPAAKEVDRRDRVARARRRCSAQLRARRLPRRRAHRDRHLRARRGAPRRSTSGAARICSARCSGRWRSGTSSRRAPRGSSGSRRAGSPRSARSPSRPRSSRGWSAIPIIRFRERSPSPGHEIQHRLATAEPTPEQLEVAEAALAACLELENGDQD